MYHFKSILEGTSIQRELKNEFPNVIFNSNEDESKFELNVVLVPFKDRNKGMGTKFMKRLVQLGKKNNKNLYLTPDDAYSEEGEMNKQQLTDWYESFGFKKHKENGYTHAIINN